MTGRGQCGAASAVCRRTTLLAEGRSRASCLVVLLQGYRLGGGARSIVHDRRKLVGLQHAGTDRFGICVGQQRPAARSVRIEDPYLFAGSVHDQCRFERVRVIEYHHGKVEPAHVRDQVGLARMQSAWRLMLLRATVRNCSLAFVTVGGLGLSELGLGVSRWVAGGGPLGPQRSLRAGSTAHMRAMCLLG